jgi:Na+-translocating ferredoxin:NAD+ oxidoreductase RnfD subunit
MTARTVTIGAGTYPLVLPSLRDPRLHVASVIITVHVLGQLGLGFWVSVPQILAAILTTAILEVAITFRQTRSFVWPASAMLTGSGVALILRAVGTPPGDHWSTYAVPLFAGVAGLSLLSKYVIRYRGAHVFNPSNIGLVLAFLILGGSRVEPLDFWWAPLDAWMLAAYAVIVGGGLLITRRLHLLALAAAFWVTLAAGVGVLTASGHCMVARWSFSPVCGVDFWRTIVTSPEVLIFLFFMITDPRTVPAGRVGRVVFGVLVAVASTLLMAPQTNEFWTKVGLLAGLMVVSATRPWLERLLPEPKSAGDDLRAFVGKLRGDGTRGPLRRAAGPALAAVVLVAYGSGIVLAGTPARGPAVATDSGELLARLPSQVDPATLPPVTVSEEVRTSNSVIAEPDSMREILVTLAQNLELENQALLQRDASLLPMIDHGDRLSQMQARLRDAAASGRTTIEHYRFDSVDVRLLIPFGVQTGSSIGLESRGTVTTETYDAARKLLGTTSGPFHLTFAVRRALGDRWLNIAVLTP